MRTRLPRAMRFILPLAILAALAFAGYYSTRVVHGARVLVELRNGDSVLGNNGIVGTRDMYSWDLSTWAATFDARGWFYVVTYAQKGELSLLAFDPTGHLHWKRSLLRKNGRRMIYDMDALSASPSGKLFWYEHNLKEDAPNPLEPYQPDIIGVCDTTGKNLQEWPFKSMPLYLSAVGEDSASLWAEVAPDGGYRYTLGKRKAERLTFRGWALAVDWDGSIWGVDEDLKLQDRRSNTRVLDIWQIRPDGGREVVCRTTVRCQADLIPIWHDSDSYFIMSRTKPKRWSPGAGHKQLYRIYKNGKSEQVFSTVGLLVGHRGGDERVGRCFYVKPDGTTFFETMTWVDPDSYLSYPVYRIYKAQPMPRWRAWLAKMGR